MFLHRLGQISKRLQEFLLRKTEFWKMRLKISAVEDGGGVVVCADFAVERLK
jgi:hypothetical protein